VYGTAAPGNFGFMTALLARNVVRPRIIKERSVPVVLQIKHRDHLHSPTSSGEKETVTGRSVRTHTARDPTGIGCHSYHQWRS